MYCSYYIVELDHVIFLFLRCGSSFYNVMLKLSQVVASMDWPEVSKYTCLVSSQGHREEIIADLFTEVKDPQKGVIYGGMIR